MIARIASILVFLALVGPMHAQTIGSWQRISTKITFPLWDVAFIDSLRGVAVGDYGVILRTKDGGFTWTHTLSDDQFALRNVHFFDDSTGIAAGFRGSIFRSTDGGERWSKVPIPHDVNFPGMCAVGSTVWLAGEEGLVLKSTDRGTTWKSINSGSPYLLGSIAFSDEQHGWAASMQRQLLRSTDGGLTWKEQKLTTFLPVTSVHALSANDGLLCGYHGLVMRTSDGGASWAQLSSHQADYMCIATDSTGRGWAVGKRGVVAQGRKENFVWKLFDVLETKSLYSICFLPNGAAIAVGDEGGVYRLSSIGITDEIPAPGGVAPQQSPPRQEK